MTDFTPSVEQMRRAYVTGMRFAFIASAGEHGEEFDRGIARVRAGARAELLREEAERADRAWREWGDVNDATRRDALLESARTGQ